MMHNGDVYYWTELKSLELIVLQSSKFAPLIAAFDKNQRSRMYRVVCSQAGHDITHHDEVQTVNLWNQLWDNKVPSGTQRAKSLTH